MVSGLFPAIKSRAMDLVKTMRSRNIEGNRDTIERHLGNVLSAVVLSFSIKVISSTPKIKTTCLTVKKKDHKNSFRNTGMCESVYFYCTRKCQLFPHYLQEKNKD